MAVKEGVNRSAPYTVYPGVAAEDFTRDNNNLLRVIVPDLQPHAPYGDLAAGKTPSTVSLKTSAGTTSSAQITLANHVEATWEGTPGHRYAPDVVKGEPVEVFQRGNQDKWYWRETARGRNFRKTDRICVEISATATNSPNTRGDKHTSPDSTKDDTTTWSCEMDSKNKFAEFRSSQANGEVCQWRLRFDMAQGQFFIIDDPKAVPSTDSNNTTHLSNSIFLDTGKHTGLPVFQVNLNTGTTIKLQDKDAYIKIPKKCVIDIGERLIVNSPLSIFNKSTAGYIFVNAASVALSTAADAVVTAGGIVGINTKSMKLSGTFIANGIRSISFIKGVVGALYSAIKIGDIDSGSVSTPSNAADTDLSGAGDRTATAAEEVSSMMRTITEALSEISAVVGVGSVGGKLMSLAQKAFMKSIKGDG